MPMIYVTDENDQVIRSLQEKTGLKTGVFFEKACDAFISVYGEAFGIALGNGGVGKGETDAGDPKTQNAAEAAET